MATATTNPLTVFSVVTLNSPDETPDAYIRIGAVSAFERGPDNSVLLVLNSGKEIVSVRPDWGDLHRLLGAAGYQHHQV